MPVTKKTAIATAKIVAGRLRDLRDSEIATLESISERIGVTVGQLRSWESGKVLPNESQLRDLALGYGTSVEDLYGTNPLHTKIETVSTNYADSDNISGFWGHIGVLLPGQAHSLWYPISVDEAHRIDEILSWARYGERSPSWIQVATQASRFLFINMAKIRHLTLLDDCCDGVEGDWYPENILERHSFETFRVVHELIREGIDEPEGSPFFVKYAKAAEETLNEEHPDLDSFMMESRIYQPTGDVLSYGACMRQARNLQFALDVQGGDTGTKIINLGGDGGEFDRWYPEDTIAMLDVPLVEFIDALKEDDD